MFKQQSSTDSRSPAAPVEDARSAAAGDVGGRMGWDGRWDGMGSALRISFDDISLC